MAVTSEFNFKAEDKKIEDILFSRHKFRVPRFQRPYTWSTDQIVDFWNDINSSKESYFLGSFVFNFEFEGKDGYIEIIDGQQRLLTITILMAAIRDTAKEMKEEGLANRIQTNCIAIEDRRGIQTYRVQCGDSLNVFFEKFIQNEDKPEYTEKILKEHKLIVDNYNYLKKEIKDELDGLSSKTEKVGYLQKIFDIVAELRTIWIRIESDDDAYIVFETVNARGAELSVADLLKNLILKNLRASNQIDIAKEKWTALEENIRETGTEIPKFIRQYWLSKYSFTGEKKLYKEIKNNITNFERFLDELLEASQLYNLLLQGSKDEWRDKFSEDGIKMHTILQGIRIMRVNQCFVLLLCLLRNKKKIGFSVLNYWKNIENFTFNYSAISKLQANKVERLYSKHAIEVEELLSEGINKRTAQNVERKLDILINDLKAIKPGFSIFEEKFMEIAYQNSEQNRTFIKYLLSKINATKSSSELIIDFDTVNIEHILPQNPSKEWRLNKTQIKDYVDLLGNLTLIHKKLNSAASNNGPKKKAEIFKQSEVAITKELEKDLKKLDYSWKEENIKKRQANYSKIAYEKIWSL